MNQQIHVVTVETVLLLRLAGFEAVGVNPEQGFLSAKGRRYAGEIGLAFFANAFAAAVRPEREDHIAGVFKDQIRGPSLTMDINREREG